MRLSNFMKLRQKHSFHDLPALRRAYLSSIANIETPVTMDLASFELSLWLNLHHRRTAAVGEQAIEFQVVTNIIEAAISLINCGLLPILEFNAPPTVSDSTAGVASHSRERGFAGFYALIHPICLVDEETGRAVRQCRLWTFDFGADAFR